MSDRLLLQRENQRLFTSLLPLLLLMLTCEGMAL